jgi:thiamine biosynthesis lipoprotein
MATLFEAWLVGDDEEHLIAVAEAAFDEIERIERVLSRFDRGAELQRVNRTAATEPVRLSVELYDVVADCLRCHAATEGYFDPTATGFVQANANANVAVAPLPFSAAVQLDPEQRTIVFTEPDVRLDLGGYGKGYALDAAVKILDRYGIESALLHGGTSSVLSRGRMADGRPWMIAVGDPFIAERPEIAKFALVDAGLSTSASLDVRHATSDIVDPIVGKTVGEAEAFCVLAPTATEAEVLSTALTAMGRVRAIEYLRLHADRWSPRVEVACVTRTDEMGEVSWLRKAK